MLPGSGVGQIRASYGGAINYSCAFDLAETVPEQGGKTGSCKYAPRK